MDSDNKRLEDIILFLEKNRLIKNPTDFAKKIQYDTGSITKIIEGKRGFSNGIKWKIYDAFRISKPFLFDGIGKIDIEPAQKEIDNSNEVDKLRELVKVLKGSMKSQQTTIEGLMVQVSSLQKELERNITYKKEAKQKKANKS